MSVTINGELSVRAHVATDAMDWSPSPSGTVWRKRVHLVGPAESGQVTSIVRYEPGSTFPRHDHPDGEEIFVLDGVFSDEHGDWQAGTCLLNPEGFSHRPFSKPGCRLFVKLRQFPGRGRDHVAIDANELEWADTTIAGVAQKLLYRQEGFTDETRLERWQPASSVDSRTYDEGVEIFVIEGEFADDEGAYAEGTWLRLPPGTKHAPRSATGCTLYLKTGGFSYLNQAEPGT